MLAKCNGNFVNGPQRIPRTNIGTSTACSVMKPGYEWHITPSIPTRDEKRRASTDVP